MTDQQHPLYLIDRDHVDRLLAKKSPDEDDLVNLARLLKRYQGFPGVEELKLDLDKTLKLWGMDREQLYSKTRDIWSSGYRPGQKNDEVVGSGFDTTEE